MKYLKIIFLITLFFSCKNEQETNKNQDIENEGAYLDVPFEQEYHDGYIVDEKIADANKVRAIQPDYHNNIWIATKNGVYMKSQNSRQW